jgi:hypothetical protein
MPDVPICRSVNPLYMSYAADQDGNFAGHAGYGYRSIATFVETCIAVNSGSMDWCATRGNDSPPSA